MMSKQQALHKAELHVSQLKELVNQAIQERWRADELERSLFTKLLDLGFELFTAFVAAQGDGDQGPQRDAQTMPPVDEEGELVVATADGKGVPMRRPVEAQTRRPAGHRRGKGEKAQKKQTAYVGAVYTIDRFPRTADEIVDELLRKQRAKDRPSPQHKHVRVEMTRPGEGPRESVLLHGPSHLFAGLALECQARNSERKKPLVCLLDGERQFWDLQQQWLPRAVQILDIFHVNERLWTAPYCFHPEKSPAAERFVEHYLRLLLQGQVDTVIRSFRQLLATRKLRGEKRRRLQATITYYDNNRTHMRYADYLAAGYPIGSGVAEGACRHLVKDRMERTGMRWSLTGAQAMLNLRALYINGDWDAFVEHRIEREQDTLSGQAA